MHSTPQHEQLTYGAYMAWLAKLIGCSYHVSRVCFVMLSLFKS